MFLFEYGYVVLAMVSSNYKSLEIRKWLDTSVIDNTVIGYTYSISFCINQLSGKPLF